MSQSPLELVPCARSRRNHLALPVGKAAVQRKVDPIGDSLT